MIMPNDKTLITAKTSINQDTYILYRIYKAIEIIQDEGYQVASAHCSSKVFMEISRKIAPKVGFLEKDIILLQQRRHPTDIPKSLPLVRDKTLIYNKEKEFYLKVVDPLTQRNGMVFPTFNKTSLQSMEIKDGEENKET